MASAKYLQRNSGINALEPKADRFATAGETDVIRATGCEAIYFAVLLGAAADNTNTITVLACDNVTPTTETAIPFMYRLVSTAGTYGAVTAATTSGIAIDGDLAANQYYEIEVDPSDVEAANSHAGNQFVRCTVTEGGTATAQLGAIYCLRMGEHNAHDVPASAIA
jgi:hypothetical protein